MSLLATPFHARAAAMNRLNAWENRGRFTLASHYGSVAEEAVAARFGAVLGDRSWHWRVEFSGDKAEALVSRLFTRDAAALGPGAAMDVLWLNDAGAIRGQGMVIRTGRDRFRLVSPIVDAAWIEAAATLYGVAVEDRTQSEGLLALIGPAAAKILKAAGLEADLAPLSWRSIAWRGLEVSLSRTALGYDIACAGEDGAIVWDRLAAAGRDRALLPAGLAALDMLEIESGVVCPGRDYAPACDGFATEPLPAALGLGGLVDRGHLFNGRPGVLAAGPDAVLAGVLFDGEAPQPFTVVRKEGESVGITLSACRSAALQQAIALAVFPKGLPQGGLTAGGTVCRPVGLPFLPSPTATETPAVAVESLMRAAGLEPANGG